MILCRTHEIEEEEYNDFYKTLTKGHDNPMTRIHFTAEGEVTFRSLLYIPKELENEILTNYGKKHNIKLYVQRVFITDDFTDMMPNYLSFIRGIIDSDDLPLNISRETLQQHKLLKGIKENLVQKVLNMINNIPDDKYPDFWKEFSTK